MNSVFFVSLNQVQNPSQLVKVDEEMEEDKEEVEPSNSLPSSPKSSVRSPLSCAHSHSFDDLLSSVNNEVITSPTSVTSPQSPFRHLTPKQVPCHPLGSGESGSDSEIEMSEFSSMGRKRVSATNPLSDHFLDDNLDEDHSETDTDKSGDEHARRPAQESTITPGLGVGKFAQLKGKFFQRVSSLKPPKSTLKFRPLSRLHQSESGGDTDSSIQSQFTGKFASIRKGQATGGSRSPKNHSSLINELSEEELKRQKAMERSKTNFLILKAV